MEGFAVRFKAGTSLPMYGKTVESLELEVRVNGTWLPFTVDEARINDVALSFGRLPMHSSEASELLLEVFLKRAKELHTEAADELGEHSWETWYASYLVGRGVRVSAVTPTEYAKRLIDNPRAATMPAEEAAATRANLRRPR